MSLWDDSARQYDAFEKRWHQYEKIANGLLEQLEIRDDSNILELASGTGACSKLLGAISKNKTIIGIDSSAEMVRIAKENIMESGLSNVSFVIGDVSEIANIFPKGQFDFIACNSAFWQFSDPLKVSIDVHSLLRTAGQIGFNIPQWFPSDEARNLFRKKVREIFESHGLSVPERGTLWNQTRNYHEILDNAGFAEIRETHYEFEAPREMTKEWREIPAFSDQFRSSKFPQSFTDEISKEFQKVQNNSSKNMRTSSWKILTATKKNA